MIHYLHIGSDEGRAISSEEIIGIFDMDSATVAPTTRRYLSRAEKLGLLSSEGLRDLPKSFILTDGGVVMSRLAPASLAGRLRD